LLTLKAPAKINLTLEVLGRRDDGYHDIVSVIQTLDLFDTLTLEPSDTVTLECDAPGLQTPDNLVVKAAQALKKATGYPNGALIGLQKKIPVAGGMGGGSSDAAATLKGLNRLWELGLTMEQLLPLAASQGSDVPFFLYGGTAMVRGRGEIVRPLPPADLGWIVVLSPAIGLPRKTESLYAALGRSNFTRGALTRKLEARIRGGGDAPAQFLFNAFDSVAPEAFPGLREYWDIFHSLGAREIHLAGSGPSMFAPVSHREVGTALQLLLGRRYGLEAHLASAWQPPGEQAK
jgi:4-diphosphocytidyl-2-C-methyl-D-erythritol kinase